MQLVSDRASVIASTHAALLRKSAMLSIGLLPLVRRERGSLPQRRPPAHQFLLPEIAPTQISLPVPPVYVIRVLDGSGIAPVSGL
jgi:hypothetical protein